MDIDAFRKQPITAIEKFKENGGALIVDDRQVNRAPKIPNLYLDSLIVLRESFAFSKKKHHV